MVTLLAHSSHDKGLELTLNIKNDVPDNVIGDPLRLQQVITNLVGNAIKFTESGNIDILVEKRAISNNKVQIEVQIRDTGIGIPERDQSRLFRRFVRRMRVFRGVTVVRAWGWLSRKNWLKRWAAISLSTASQTGVDVLVPYQPDLNPNVLTDGPVTDCLKGKRLAYVEPNAAAAQCTLDILSTTPLEVVYSPTFCAYR